MLSPARYNCEGLGNERSVAKAFLGKMSGTHNLTLSRYGANQTPYISKAKKGYAEKNTTPLLQTHDPTLLKVLGEQLIRVVRISVHAFKHSRLIPNGAGKLMICGSPHAGMQPIDQRILGVSVPDFMTSLIKVGVTTVLTNKKSRKEDINVSSHIGNGELLTARISSQTMYATPIPQDTPLLPTTAIQADATIKMNSLNARIHAPERVKAQILQP